MRYVVTILLLITTRFTQAQMIVNVENSRIQSDTTGWKGDAGTSFSFTKNVQQILSINASLHLQYKTVKNMYLLLGNYNLLKANNADLFNNMFYHFRFNRKLGEVVRFEAFTQMQQNNINNIELRALLGAGFRLRLHDSKKLKLFGASLAMYEHEKDTKPEITYNDLRSDNYVSFTYMPNDIFSLSSTTFYQPLFKQINDFRILNQVSFSVKATKHISLSTNWDYSHELIPGIGNT